MIFKKKIDHSAFHCQQLTVYRNFSATVTTIQSFFSYNSNAIAIQMQSKETSIPRNNELKKKSTSKIPAKLNSLQLKPERGNEKS